MEDSMVGRAVSHHTILEHSRPEQSSGRGSPFRPEDRKGLGSRDIDFLCRSEDIRPTNSNRTLDGKFTGGSMMAEVWGGMQKRGLKREHNSIRQNPIHFHLWSPTMTSITRCAICALGFASLLCISGGMDALAQPIQTAPAIVDTFIAVVPPRAMEEITKDSEHASALRSQAKQCVARAEEEVRTLESMIKARNKDLEALETHIDTLDSEKKATEIARLKQKCALLEKVRDLLKLRVKVREGEVDAAKATVAYTEAQEEFYSLEGTLAKKRLDRADLAKKPGSAADLAAMDTAIKDLEGEVLDRWETALKKHAASVSEERDFVSLLRKLADAQAEFHAQ
jgi:hypothetical protein